MSKTHIRANSVGLPDRRLACPETRASADVDAAGSGVVSLPEDNPVVSWSAAMLVYRQILQWQRRQETCPTTMEANGHCDHREASMRVICEQHWQSETCQCVISATLSSPFPLMDAGTRVASASWRQSVLRRRRWSCHQLVVVSWAGYRTRRYWALFALAVVELLLNPWPSEPWS